MMTRKHLKEEAIRLYDTGDTRTFKQIYSGREELFEDNIDDIISPKMRALFEQTYNTCNPSTKLKEEVGGDASKNPDHNFSGAEGKPSGDGVPDAHNKAGLSGEDPAAVQGQGRGDSSNTKLFNEMKAIYEKAKLYEEFGTSFDLDDEDDFDFDAAEGEAIADENEIEDLDAESLDDLGDFEDTVFEDYDDGSSLDGSYEDMDYSGDEFDLE